MAIQILGRDSSYNVQKVLWLARELELQIDHTQLGGRYGGNDTVEFSALNPMQRVPVMIEDGHAIWESNTILRYLLARHGNAAWQSPDAFVRSEYERWMDWAQVTFEPAFIGVFWGYYRTPEAQRDAQAIADSVRDCEMCMDQLERQLDDSAYLVGDRLTLADICTGVFLFRLAEVDLQMRMPPRVQAWYKRLKTRPAYQVEVMRDFSELAGRLEF